MDTEETVTVHIPKKYFREGNSISVAPRVETGVDGEVTYGYTLAIAGNLMDENQRRKMKSRAAVDGILRVLLMVLLTIAASVALTAFINSNPTVAEAANGMLQKIIGFFG